jgi:hypothetical protein
MAVGQGIGENRAMQSCAGCNQSPLLDLTIEGTRCPLQCQGRREFTLYEVNSRERRAVSDLTSISSLAQDRSEHEDVADHLIATGFQQRQRQTAGAGLTAGNVIAAPGRKTIDFSPTFRQEIRHPSFAATQVMYLSHLHCPLGQV